MTDKQKSLLQEAKRLEAEASSAVDEAIASISEEIDEEIQVIRKYLERGLTRSKEAAGAIHFSKDRLGVMLRRLDEIGNEFEADARLYKMLLQRSSPKGGEQPEVHTPAEALVTSGELKDMSRRQAALRVLRRAKQSMTTREIQTLLEAGGVKFGDSGSSALSASLAQANEFVSMKEQGKNKWSLKEWKDDEIDVGL